VDRQEAQQEIQGTLHAIVGLATQLLDERDARRWKTEGTRLRDLVEYLLRIANDEASHRREDAGHDGRPLRRPDATPMSTLAPGGGALSYDLPSDLLDAYHRLLDRKFARGLTPEEEAELARVSQNLDEAEAATPLYQSSDAKLRRQHARTLAMLDEIIEKVKALEEPA
jgi:hypothetical protein